ncbi:facilitated trehalose transporter Tret1-2 homolog isoform X2 [Palaemon carinicauda]|uniref:facilitated trehalose transporter Tret1-2 homolog isoform X2 n=1 Tax=Palaemon carinicauda TaxID=392227 RepID=UPI0035B680D0
MELDMKKPVVNGSRYEGKETPALRRIRHLKLVLLVVSAGLGYSSAGGMAIVWPNVFAVHTAKDNSTIFNTAIHLNSWQMDMIASMMFVGSMPGFLLAGWLVGTIGRRKSMLAAAVPTIIGTLIIAMSYNAYMLIFGRFLDGVAFGMTVVSVRTYMVEIAGLNFRGAASVIVNIMMQIGGVTMLSLGIILSWYHVAFLSCGTTLFYCCIIIPFLPESPAYLAVNNRETEALEVLLQLRGPYADIHEELTQLKQMNLLDGGKKEGFRGLLRVQHLKKLLVLFVLFLISNFSGVQVLKSNTVRILESSGLKFNQSVSAIIVTMALMVGNFTMMLLVDKIGRRYCLMFSFSLVAVAYYCLGSYNFIMDFNHVEQELNIENLSPMISNTTVTYDINASVSTGIDWSWVPLVCLLVAALGQSAGAGPIPYVVAPEYFPTNVRSQGMSLCTMMGGLQSFAALQLFSPLQDILTKGGLYWLYAATATIGVPYTIFFIQETSGKRVG